MSFWKTYPPGWRVWEGEDDSQDGDGGDGGGGDGGGDGGDGGGDGGDSGDGGDGGGGNDFGGGGGGHHHNSDESDGDGGQDNSWQKQQDDDRKREEEQRRRQEEQRRREEEQRQLDEQRRQVEENQRRMEEEQRRQQEQQNQQDGQGLSVDVNGDGTSDAAASGDPTNDALRQQFQDYSQQNQQGFSVDPDQQKQWLLGQSPPISQQAPDSGNSNIATGGPAYTGPSGSLFDPQPTTPNAVSTPAPAAAPTTALETFPEGVDPNSRIEYRDGKKVWVEPDGDVKTIGDGGYPIVIAMGTQAEGGPPGTSPTAPTDASTSSTAVPEIAATAAASATAQAGGNPHQIAQAATHAAKLASDGQTLAQQSSWTRAAFRSQYGANADAEWQRQHAAELDRNQRLYGAREPKAGTAPQASAPQGTPVAPNRRIGATRPPLPGETAQYGINYPATTNPAGTTAPDAARTAAPGATTPSATGPQPPIVSNSAGPGGLSNTDQAQMDQAQGIAISAPTSLRPSYTGSGGLSPQDQAQQQAVTPVDPTVYRNDDDLTIGATGLDGKPVQVTVSRAAWNSYGPTGQKGWHVITTAPSMARTPGAPDDVFSLVEAGGSPTSTYSITRKDWDSATPETKARWRVQNITRPASQAVSDDYAAAASGQTPPTTPSSVPPLLVPADREDRATAVSGQAPPVPTPPAPAYNDDPGTQPGGRVSPWNQPHNPIPTITPTPSPTASPSPELPVNSDRGGTPTPYPTPDWEQHNPLATPSVQGTPDVPNETPTPTPSPSPTGTPQPTTSNPLRESLQQDTGQATLALKGESTDPVLTAVASPKPIDTLAQLAAMDKGPNYDASKDAYNIAQGIAGMLRGDPNAQWAEPYLNDVARLAWAREEQGNGRNSDPRQSPAQYIEKWKDAFFGSDTNVPLVREINQQLQTAGANRTGEPAASGQPTPQINSRSIIDAYKGVPYTFGGPGGRSDPNLGTTTDCSGFVSAVWKNTYGLNLAPQTDASYNQLRDMGAPEIAAKDAQNGDVVYYMGAGIGGTITHHMGIYAGNGKVLDMSVDGTPGVSERDLGHAGKFIILRDPRLNNQVPGTAKAPPSIVPSGDSGGVPLTANIRARLSLHTQYSSPAQRATARVSAEMNASSPSGQTVRLSNQETTQANPPVALPPILQAGKPREGLIAGQSEPVDQMARVYSLAQQQTGDKDFSDGLSALLIGEGGMHGGAGDNGQSYGPYQFYWGGGEGNNFERWLRDTKGFKGTTQQAQQMAKDVDLASEYYLPKVKTFYDRGKQMGYTNPVQAIAAGGHNAGAVNVPRVWNSYRDAWDNYRAGNTEQGVTVQSQSR